MLNRRNFFAALLAPIMARFEPRRQNAEALVATAGIATYVYIHQSGALVHAGWSTSAPIAVGDILTFHVDVDGKPHINARSAT